MSQNPKKRPRVSPAGGPCMTLTASSTHLWCPSQRRTLSGTEMLLGQGFVTISCLGSVLNQHMLLGVSDLTHTALTRLAGNAMHVAAVGSILLWVAIYGETLPAADPERLFAKRICVEEAVVLVSGNPKAFGRLST